MLGELVWVVFVLGVLRLVGGGDGDCVGGKKLQKKLKWVTWERNWVMLVVATWWWRSHSPVLPPQGRKAIWFSKFPFQ